MVLKQTFPIKKCLVFSTFRKVPNFPDFRPRKKTNLRNLALKSQPGNPRLSPFALLGAADAVTVAVRQTTVLLTTPDEMRGRAYALMILAAQTANNIGTIWVGFWAGAIGAGNTMVMGGIISITATAVIWYVWKPIGRYRSAA